MTWLLLVYNFSQQIKNDRNVIFRWMNMPSMCILEALTTIIRLKNISSTKINYLHHMFVPCLALWIRQLLLTGQPPLFWQIWVVRANLPINECGHINLQMKNGLIYMVHLHTLHNTKVLKWIICVLISLMNLIKVPTQTSMTEKNLSMTKRQ